MPYKNTAAKQQWEREHREQRNARRRRRNVTARIESIGPISVPDPRFQSEDASSLTTASSQELEVGYVVALLLVFLVVLGLVMYFTRAGRATTKTPSGPIPEKKLKRNPYNEFARRLHSMNRETRAETS
jgi:hypothetical protein